MRVPFLHTLKSLIDEQTGINEQGWKKVTLIAYLLSKLINEQGGIFHLLHEKLRAGWKENLKNLRKHALLLGTSEYAGITPALDQNSKAFNTKSKTFNIKCFCILIQVVMPAYENYNVIAFKFCIQKFTMCLACFACWQYCTFDLSSSIFILILYPHQPVLV